MSLLAWNCRGLGNPRTVTAFKKLLKDKDPSIVFISETKKKDFEINAMRHLHGFSNLIAVSCQGEGRERAGGLACFWNDTAEVQILSISLNHIDMLVNMDNGDPWRCTGIYGFPDSNSKHKTCELIDQLAARDQQDKWLLFGDFNLLLAQHEKEGGNLADLSLIELFRDTMQKNSLVDLGFEGDQFTWSNNQDGSHNIRARLDRMIASHAWSFSYPKASVLHLLRHASDHLPLLLRLHPNHVRKRRHILKLDRFEECWLRDEEIDKAVKDLWLQNSSPLGSKIQDCVKDLSRWGEARFGDIPKRIKETSSQLQALHLRAHEEGMAAEIKKVEKVLDDLLESEEIWWAQRSRAMWLKHGDKNTKFFHQKASQRKSRNWVDCIWDDHGEKFTEEVDIERVITNFFQDLFTTSDSERITEAVEVVQNRLSDDMRHVLDQDFTREEVYQAVKNLKSHAAPGPDGMPAFFYQRFWPIVGDEVTNLALNILNNGMCPRSINQTYICLIPKKKKPINTGDFRPISLCNVIFKIVTKTIANRLKLILPEIIDKYQSAFVPGRLITDNTLIAFDCFHYMRKKKKGKKGFVGLKLDMSKAYDRIEWNFLSAVLNSMGFSQKWQTLINNCISTVSFSILLNGSPGQKFSPQRGLRQGDPLSPYLFIMCAEVFSGLIRRAQENSAIHGIQIARGAPMISHLLFADDSLIFCRSSSQDAQAINNILQLYQSASGQLINLDKSEISFSRNVPTDRRQEFQGWIQITAVENHSKYLGLPAFVGRSKQQVFDFVQDRVWKKLKGWKEKFLSNAAREVLIKAVVQAIPTYVMSCFLLPVGLCDHIESMISRFWWGSKNGERKIHWINWNYLCKEKKMGGMGFRRFHAFNLALLAKQGWRIYNHPDSLTSKCLRARYFPRGSFLKASVGFTPSYTWRSIHQAIWVIRKGGFWRVGTGHFIDIWEDNWIPTQNGYKLWTPKPADCLISMVAELINHEDGCWNSALINQVFLPFEAQQIMQIPLLTVPSRDTFVWGPNKRGIFSVKSAYEFISKHEENLVPQNSDAASPPAIWTRLWKLKSIPRHLHLAWKLLHRKIPVRSSLFKKGINCSPLCPRCNASVETINHVFIDCDWAKSVWFGSPLGIHFTATTGRGTDFVAWLEEVIMNEEAQIVEQVLSLCYSIWFSRNKICFENKEISPQDAISKALNVVQCFQSSQNCRLNNSSDMPVDRNVSWSAPPMGWYKLNTDAAGPIEGCWGIGAVIRNEESAVMATATWLIPSLPDPELAEALAVLKGVQLARDLFLLQLEVESDSLTVVRALQSSSNAASYFDIAISECKNISTSFHNFKCSHVPREANKVAHALAKYAFTSPDKVWVEEYPDCIASILAFDCLPSFIS